MIKLLNKETGEQIGTLTEEQLQYLVDELEEESNDDQDYWLNRAQVEIFKDNGADPALLLMLETALGEGEELEVCWERS
ncbi:MAG TPA: galactosyldiacylglycerol synthase [Gammaproteobacteria bacterium]